MTAAVAVGVLVAAGVYLILQRGLVRVTVGFVLLGHAANVVLIAAGGMRLRGAPLIGSGDPATMADPLPQAFVLTAIVITFGVTVYLLAIARAGGDDDDPAPGDGDSGSGSGSDGGSGNEDRATPGGDHPSEDERSSEESASGSGRADER